MYHRIARESFDPWGLAVSPERFEQQLGWLSRHRVVLPLEEFAGLHLQRKLPRTAVALTFDDGYSCSLRVAAPLLDRAGLPATIFLSAQLIARRREFWWDELVRMALEFDGSELVLDGRKHVIPSPSVEDRWWAAGDPPSTPRQHLYLQLWSALRCRDVGEVDRMLDDLREQAKIPSRDRNEYQPIKESEIGSTGLGGVTFGSHAMSHRPLTSLDERERRREITESITSCAKLTGETPKTFAYPFGDCDEETAQMVREAGLLCACTTEPALVVSRTSPFMIPRLQVGDWEPRRLAKALRGR